MKISYIRIQNFKSIRDLEITELENALILVGKNNTGKTNVIDAILAATGYHTVCTEEFLDPQKSIDITLSIEFTEEDLQSYQTRGMVSRHRDYEKWLEEFRSLIPSFQDNTVTFTFHINPEHKVRYNDGFRRITHTSGRFFRRSITSTRPEIWTRCRMMFLVFMTKNPSRCSRITPVPLTPPGNETVVSSVSVSSIRKRRRS